VNKEVVNKEVKKERITTLARERTFLANDRTLLAFWRTALTCVVTALIILKFFNSYSYLIATVLILFGASLVWYGIKQYHYYKKRIIEI